MTGILPPSSQSPQQGKASRGRWWITAAAFVLIGAQIGACSCEEEGPGTSNPTVGSLLPPALQSEVPMQTNVATLPMNGSKPISTGVLVDLNGTPVEVNAVDALGIWNGSIELKEGDNSFTLASFNDAGDSSTPSRVYEVVLDTTAPGVPALDAEPEACVPGDTLILVGSVDTDATLIVNGEKQEVADDGSFEVGFPLGSDSTDLDIYAEDDLGNRSDSLTYSVRSGVPTPTLETVESPTGNQTQTLRGTKEAGVGVLLIIEGEDDREIVAPNQDTTWTYDLELGEGEVTFSIDGFIGDKRGCEPSDATSIVYSNVCPPTVDRTGLVLGEAFSEPDEVTLNIERCEGVTTWLRVGDQPLEEATRIDTDDDAAAFSYTYSLREGLNRLRVYNRDALDIFSPPDGPLDFILDTIAPSPVVVTAPAEANSSVMVGMYSIVGTKEGGSGVCIIRSPGVDCESTIEPGNAMDFTFADVVLNVGDNTFELVAFDEAGNESRPTRVTLSRDLDSTPAIDIRNPTNNSIVNVGPLQVEAEVVSANTITSVEICFDTDCSPAPANGDIYRRTIQVPDTLLTGSSHEVTVRATNDLDQEGTATSSVLFIEGGLPLSTTTPEAVSRTPKVVVDGLGRVHAFWSDDCTGQEGCEVTADTILPGDILHRVLSDGRWSAPERVSSDTNDGDSRDPGVVADAEGNLHMIWVDDGNMDGPGGDLDIYYRFYNINDDTWGDIELVTDGSTMTSQSGDLAVSSDGSVHVVWEETNGIIGNIQYAVRSPQNDWSPVVTLTDADFGIGARAPEVAVDLMSRVFVVWQEETEDEDQDIFLAMGEDGLFGEALLISDSFLDGDSRLPQLEVDTQGIAHIVWRDTAELFQAGGDLDLFHRTYDADSESLGNYRLITTMPPDAASDDAAMYVDPSTDDLYVTWASYENEGQGAPDLDIYYSRYIGAFMPAVLVSEGDLFNGLGTQPDITFDPMGDIVHVIWADESLIPTTGEDQDIYYFGFPMP